MTRPPASHPIAEEDLHAWLDGALPPARAAEVEAHLAARPEEAARIAAYRAEAEALRRALGPVAEAPVPAALDPAALVDRGLRRGAAGQGNGAGLRRDTTAGSAGWGYRILPAVPAARRLAAALALFAIGLGAGWGLRGIAPGASGGDAGVASLMHEAADNYALYAAADRPPEEIAGSDPAVLSALLTKRMGHGVMVPDLSASGYRLMGARLVATSHGPAAFLMYDDAAGTRLVMLTRPVAAKETTRMKEHRLDRLNSFTWAARGMGYSLVAPVATDRLHPIAAEVLRQVMRKT